MHLQDTSENARYSKSKVKVLFLTKFPRNEQNAPGFACWQLNILCQVEHLRIFASLGLVEIISDMHLVCFLKDSLSSKMKHCLELQCEISYATQFLTFESSFVATQPALHDFTWAQNIIYK